MFSEHVAGAAQVAKAATMFSISSVAMIILNKAAAVSFPHIAILLLLQNLATISILWMTSDLKPISDVSAWQWLPCAFLFCVNLFSSLQSLVFISVPTFTVLRNTQPLIAVAMDFLLRGQRTKPERILYLFQILVGAIVYCSHDIDFELRGYGWAAVHVLSMTCYSIIVKTKCTELGLSAQDMSYYNNVLSIPGLVMVGALEPLFRMGTDANVMNDILACGTQIRCLLVILLSCLGGYCVSVSGFQAQQVMSPTSWLCLNNFSKIPAIAISYVLFGGYFAVATVHGMLISIVGTYMYSVAGKRTTTARMQIFSVGLVLSSSIWIDSEAIRTCQGLLCLSGIRLDRFWLGMDAPQAWYARPTCRLWGVTTTIFEPSPAISQFLRQNDTCLVIVGDLKTNHSSWQAFVKRYNERGFYLSPSDQIRLPLTSIRHLPWNHFGRKNIGYLFVCRHGGKMIYDFDDDNSLREESVLFKNIVQGNLERVQVVSRKHHLFNPYPGFSPVDANSITQFVWPRGFPLNFIHDPNTSTVSFNKTVDPQKIAVFQSLANNDPDVDAIFRMTRKLPITFQLEETIRAVPDGTYSPWNSQAVLVRDVAFWGLFLPISVTGRVSDIWRSYITSRMLFATPYSVAFTSPFVIQYRNPHDYQIDLVDEQDLYLKTNEMVRTISEFSIRESAPFHANLIRLIDSLKQKKIIGAVDALLARSWVFDLHSMNYSWPTMTSDFPPFTPPRGRVFDFRRFSLDEIDNRADTVLLPSLDKSAAQTRSTSSVDYNTKEYSHGSTERHSNVSWLALSHVHTPGNLAVRNESQDTSYGSNVAVCIRGLVHKFASQNIISNLIQPLGADTFIVTSSSERLRDYLQPYKKKQLIYGLHVSVENSPALITEKFLKDGGLLKKFQCNALSPLNKAKGAGLFQYLDMKNCGDLIRKEEKRRGRQYSWIIVTRNDLFWPFRHLPVENLIAGFTHIPCLVVSGTQTSCRYDYGGYNDMHFVLPRKHANVVFDIWLSLTTKPHKLLQSIQPNDNVERLMKKALDLSKISVKRYTPGCLKGCSLDGLHSVTSWHPKGIRCYVCVHQHLNLSFSCRDPGHLDSITENRHPRIF